jgi:hypothetical protein
MPPTLQEVRLRIEAACARANRPVSDVTLVGASKRIPAERLVPFFEAGLVDFGENYVQEGLGKIHDFEAAGLRANWHLIGALQTNKARDAVRHFGLIHSVDRPSLAEALDKAAANAGKVQDVLLQINLAGEESKAGCAPESAAELLEQIRAFPQLRCLGLMSLPPYLEEPEAMRPYHAQLRELRDKLAPGSLPILSMGMSNDFEVAIEEGATHVRVGTRLFGGRV